MKCLGLIPARAGSKRIVSKNTQLLEGHPLIAYTIGAARESGVFERIIVSTESEEVAEIARSYGAEVPFPRPVEMAGDRSPDIEWIRYTLGRLQDEGSAADCFSILRPTSPFRMPETIRRAWETFREDGQADSLRAIEKCAQHPAKMWQIEGRRMQPIMVNPDASGTPWHSSPYQSLPPIYAQNASLEIAWCRVPLEDNTIAGDEILPFVTENYEGFDINYPEDWAVAEYLIREGLAELPPVHGPA